MFIVDVISFVNILILVSSIELLPSRRRYHLDRFDGSCRGENVTMRASYRVTKHDERSWVIYLNGTINVTEDFPKRTEGISKVSRCLSKESLDTCEPFVTKNLSNYCDMLDHKLPGINFFLRYTPEFKCPIKKGIYRTYKSKFDLAPFLVNPMDNWYWKSVSEIIDVETKRLLYCFKVDLYASG